MSSRVRTAVTVGISIVGLGVTSDAGWAAKVQPVPLVKRNVTGNLPALRNSIPRLPRIVGADARRADLAFARQLQSATSAGNFCRALDLVNRRVQLRREFLPRPRAIEQRHQPRV